MNRHDVTELIVTQRLAKDLSWADIAKAVGHSKEWVTAGCLGQMTFTPQQAAVIGEMLDLPAQAVKLLQVVPYKGSLPTAVPTDPLIYRFYELISVYGTTFKSLIHEEFGDGIMSAIDFNMDLTPSNPSCHALHPRSGRLGPLTYHHRPAHLALPPGL